MASDMVQLSLVLIISISFDKASYFLLTPSVFLTFCQSLVFHLLLPWCGAIPHPRITRQKMSLSTV
uniref:Uncharacterized protein n=1 Tax=Arundo donax TaxID=35708 RepID=A0A0A9DF98_ARUDO